MLLVSERSGSQRTKVLPTPISECRETVPPWDSAIWRDGRRMLPLAGAEEAVEDPIGVVRGDAWTFVADRDPGPAVAAADGENQFAAAAGQADRVREQVVDRTPQRRRVPGCGRPGGQPSYDVQLTIGGEQLVLLGGFNVFGFAVAGGAAAAEICGRGP